MRLLSGGGYSVEYPTDNCLFSASNFSRIPQLNIAILSCSKNALSRDHSPYLSFFLCSQDCRRIFPPKCTIFPQNPLFFIEIGRYFQYLHLAWNHILGSGDFYNWLVLPPLVSGEIEVTLLIVLFSTIKCYLITIYYLLKSIHLCF